MKDRVSRAARRAFRGRSFSLRVSFLVVAGTILSLAAFLWVRRLLLDTREVEFARQAERRCQALEREIRIALEAIRSLGHFYSASREVTREEFTRFARPVLTADPAITELSWLPRVPARDRARYEASVRREEGGGVPIAEVGPGGRRVAAGPRPEYFPVHYEVRGSTAPPHLGLDLGANEAARLAMERARRTGLPTGASRCPCTGGSPRGCTFLVFLPVYRGAGSSYSLRGKADELAGFVLGHLRVDLIRRRAFHLLGSNGPSLRLLDVTGEPAVMLAAADSASGPGVGRYDREMTVAGRRWRAVFTAPLTPRPPWQPWAAMGGGLLLTGLGVVLLLNQRRVARAVVRSAELHRSLVQNATYGIYRSDLAGRFLEVNPALARILGYDSVEELRGRELEKDIYVRPQDRRKILGGLGGTEEVRGLEVDWRRKDGRPTRVRLSGRVMRKPDGTIEGFEMIVEDVAERARLEEQLRRAQKLEAIGRLAGGVAHDFNNLLTIVLGQCDVLLRRFAGDPLLREKVEEIRKASARAASLTRQLLAFSRRQVLKPEVIDLNTVLRETGRLLRPLIGEDVELVEDLAPDLWPIRADAGQIAQVVMNVAVNARDAMPSGGRLLFRTSNVEREVEGGWGTGSPGSRKLVRLEISDEGEGMDAETLRRAFDPFFTTKDRARGTGLGLATVYGIVTQSGGEVRLDSAPGRGTTVDILFPRAEERPPDPAPAGAESARGPRGSGTILLVEDEEGVRALAEEILTAAGYRVFVAAAGREALEVCAGHGGTIDLLLTDVVMPGLSGRELARRIRAAHPGVRLLYISGYTDAELHRHGVLEGGFSLLEKPFTPEELERRVREILEEG